ncbi:MAG: GNAT family N-acetyltransferase [Sphingobacterium sp.]
MTQISNFQGFTFKRADLSEAETIWSIFQQAIEKRKLEGSDQWQDGYPNLQVIKNDIEKGVGYIALDGTNEIVGYLALIFELESAYEDIKDQWLQDIPYAVVHRIAVSQTKYYKGLASWMLQQTEPICREKSYRSLRADTNFDNIGMLRVFEKLGFIYCGEALVRGLPRKAFEKLL